MGLRAPGRWSRRGVPALLCAAAVVMVLSGLPSTAQPNHVTLDVTVRDFENDEGMAGLALWNGPEGFPEDIEHAIATTYVDISDGVAITTLGPVPPGMYAVTVFHDKNDNKRFDKNWIGMPREGWGVTRNARPRLRAPRFDEARVEFAAGSHPVEIRVK